MRVLSIRLGFALLALLSIGQARGGESLTMNLRSRSETRAESHVFAPVWREETWDATKTAVIVCDMWNAHHCHNAAKRVTELAPRMNEVLKTARAAGALIIHAPSSCMTPYEGHPARLRAQRAPTAANLPKDIAAWCHKIPAEEKGKYPIDQSDGGEDDDPEVHARWHDELRALGRNPDAPWTRQIDLLEIDDEDAITDSGVETWNLLEDRGIENVILVGVHTNMCVLGRPFGLRQMAQNGKHVVLMRDLTDTMYNPAMWPYVNHHTGTDFIIEHIEKFVCPTVLSTDLLEGRPFRFRGDKRPRVAVIVSEFEYDTSRTLPGLAKEHWGKDFKVNYVLNDDQARHELPGVADVLANADVAVLSIWRRTPPKTDLDAIRAFLAAGKPLVAIRTTSHAFVARDGSVPDGHDAWPEFDRTILGGTYTGHYGNHPDRGDPVTKVFFADSAADHPVLVGLKPSDFTVTSWLYKMRPLTSGATPLLAGRLGDDGPEEPVAWVHRSPAGGRIFYTSLGHPDDFKLPRFQRMLTDAIYWAAALEVPSNSP